MRAAIAGLKRGSGSPQEIGMDHIRDPDLIHRPWRWLAAVSTQANAVGQHDIAAMAFIFTSIWTHTLGPQMNGSDFVAIGLDPAPADALDTIVQEGRAAANALPPDHVVATDAEGVALTAQSLRQWP
jgi:hypothetical protein